MGTLGARRALPVMLKEPPPHRNRNRQKPSGNKLVDALKKNKRRRVKADDERERARAELGRILKHGLDKNLMGVYGMAKIADVSRELASRLIHDHAPSTRIGRPPTPRRRRV